MLFNTDTLAQDAAIKGKVTTLDGETLSGVTVSVKNGSQSSQTNAEGVFSITLPTGSAILVFSTVGYTSKEVAVSVPSEISVILEQVDQQLTEVVVTGFGTQKRESLTGAVSTITSKDLERVHGGSTVSSALAGKLPGVSFKKWELQRKYCSILSVW